MYIFLIVFSTAIDYFVSLKMGTSKNKKGRKRYLIISLICNLGLLFVFKYYNLFNESLSDLLQVIGFQYNIKHLGLVLPVGISFYTFQTLSYTIDVYRGKKKPEKHFGYFALYVSYFPQLVAGPIERPKRLLPQLKTHHTVDITRILTGLKIIAWGFFKKVVIADRVSILVNTVYNNPTEYKGIQLIVATVLFYFQIYCDFSGYADIAIGSAKVMGVDLMENFKTPIFSKSVTEF